MGETNLEKNRLAYLKFVEEGLKLKEKENLPFVEGKNMI